MKSEEEKKADIIKAEGEAESAKLINHAVSKYGNGFIYIFYLFFIFFIYFLYFIFFILFFFNFYLNQKIRCSQIYSKNIIKES